MFLREVQCASLKNIPGSYPGTVATQEASSHLHHARAALVMLLLILVPTGRASLDSHMSCTGPRVGTGTRVLSIMFPIGTTHF